MADVDPELITVQVQGLPLHLTAQAREHHDGLTRELALLAEELEQRGESNAVPLRLVHLTRTLRGTYSPFTGEQDQQLTDALAAGASSVDLTFQVPADIEDAVFAFAQLLDEADDYCRAGGHLLTLATPPQLVAYRRWLLSQFIVQAGGGPPTPWPPDLAGDGSTP